MKKIISVFAVLALTLAAHAANSADSTDPDANYDRLDGMGASGKKVNVIEWEDNLEVHVYPKGSLRGLSLKLDKRNKDKPVMVIGYRFDNTPKPLIRRAILGISLNEGFKTYRDESADDYDKIIISNNGLASPLIAFKLDPAPAQLYPDGVSAPSEVAAGSGSDNSHAALRAPAAAGSGPAQAGEMDDSPKLDEDSGRIQPFYSKESPVRH